MYYAYIQTQYSFNGWICYITCSFFVASIMVKKL